MRRLLIATTNSGKLQEILRFLAGSGVEVVGLKEFPNVAPVDETGMTFEENAILKARCYAQQTGLPAIGDDGGLEVDALGGAPGVHSKRWLGYEASDEGLARAVVARLEDVPSDKRTARLKTCIAFYDGELVGVCTTAVEGFIVNEVADEIQSGYPYRSIFMVSKFNKLYKDLTKEEHEMVNHRIHNLRVLLPKILECLRET